MALTTAFLDTCRTAIRLLPELTTYRTAYALFDTAAAGDKGLYWQRVYGEGSPTSPAYLLRKAIRDTLNGNADGTQTALEREDGVRTLTAEFVADVARPADAAQESNDLRDLILRDQVS